MSDQILNARGRAQAAKAADYVNRRFKLTGIWSSDLSRCVQTTEALATPFRRTPTLREINLGQWEGLTWAELQVEHGALVSKYFAGDPTFQAPGGELLADVVERGRSFIRGGGPHYAAGRCGLGRPWRGAQGPDSGAARPTSTGNGQVQSEQREPHHH